MFIGSWRYVVQEPHQHCLRGMPLFGVLFGKFYAINLK